MEPRVLNRNVRARGLLELFYVSAVGSLLTIRFVLHLTGYPQLGGGEFHIAHMLWGGLLMAAATILMLTYIGTRAQRWAAFMGGVGFGAFIDELGKFITSDNNYFFHPAIGIIYAVFVILYLTLNFLSRKQRLTSREYQLNALSQLEEAILHDMDPTEKAKAYELLRHADHRSPLTRHLQTLVENVELVPDDRPGPVRRLLRALDRSYRKFWAKRSSNSLIQSFFVVESLLFVVAISWGIFANLDDMSSILRGTGGYESWMVICQTASSVIAAGFTVAGALLLPKSRVLAFEQFRRAALINILLTQFFVFSRIEFGALPGFFYNLIVLLLVTYVLRMEERQKVA